MRAYHAGDLSLVEDSEVTLIIGENRPGEYGRTQAAEYAQALTDLGHVVMVVLAAGVPLDVADALEGRPYVAVLTNGMRRQVPPHMVSARENAALVLAPENGDQPSTERRRLMAWDLSLERCDQVLLIDARPSSHAEQFAWRAIEKGVPLYVVPGPVDQATSRGANRLIATGDAQAITTPNLLARGEGSRATRGGSP